jgi:hypothetical protein
MAVPTGAFVAEDLASGTFEAKQSGEDKGVDGAHADDDGVGDRGVAKTDGEAHLVEGDTEEAEIEKRPKVTLGLFLRSSVSNGLQGRRRQRGLSKRGKNPARTTRMRPRSLLAGSAARLFRR